MSARLQGLSYAFMIPVELNKLVQSLHRWINKDQTFDIILNSVFKIEASVS